MKIAMVMSWTTPIPGREREAIEYGREIGDFWDKQAVSGQISEPEWLWATKGPNMWFVKGEYEPLMAMWSSEQGQRLLFKGGALLQDFGYAMYTCGREEALRRFEAALSEVGL